MARSKLPTTVSDAMTDSGNVLWSFIMGEQLEFPVSLNFIEDISTAGYVYEAVVVEANNIALQEERPTAIKPGGAKTTLTVRVPTFIGTWNAGGAYNKEEIVLYNAVYYKLLGGIARVDPTTPDVDPLWEVTTLSKVYVQFASGLGADWAVQPSPNHPMYGFFELRVTEPTDAVFTRTWKPVRGMVELLFSPTDITPDV